MLLGPVSSIFSPLFAVSLCKMLCICHLMLCSTTPHVWKQTHTRRWDRASGDTVTDLGVQSFPFVNLHRADFKKICCSVVIALWLCVHAILFIYFFDLDSSPGWTSSLASLMRSSGRGTWCCHLCQVRSQSPPCMRLRFLSMWFPRQWWFVFVLF